MKYGVFSERASQLSGTTIYRTPDGKEVEVSGIYDDPDCTGFMWPDKVLLGPIEHRVREGRPRTEEIKKFSFEKEPIEKIPFEKPPLTKEQEEAFSSFIEKYLSEAKPLDKIQFPDKLSP